MLLIILVYKKTFFTSLTMFCIFKTRVCLEIKLGPLMDPSQNFSSQKRDPSQNVFSQKQTLHKMFNLKNGPFINFFLLKTDFDQIFPVKNGLMINLSVQNPNICGTNESSESSNMLCYLSKSEVAHMQVARVA